MFALFKDQVTEYKEQRKASSQSFTNEQTKKNTL